MVEAVRRRDHLAIEILIKGRADLNLQARGSDLPLVLAVKQQSLEVVDSLLNLRANPTVVSYPTDRQTTPRWVGLSVLELTTPGSEIARLVSTAIGQWQNHGQM